MSRELNSLCTYALGYGYSIALDTETGITAYIHVILKPSKKVLLTSRPLLLFKFSRLHKPS